MHTSIENSREIIQNVLSAPETYAVVLKENQRAVGSIGIIEPSNSHTDILPDEREIGYWIGKPYWGLGLIPEAVNEIQRYCFEDLRLAGLWCGYYEGNIKSLRVQEKCGFKYHHTAKDVPCILMNDIRTEHFTYISKEMWQNHTFHT